MERSRQGIRLRLSAPRRMVAEYLHHARKVPALPTFRTMNLAAVADARAQAYPIPSWTAIFLRAYGLVGRAHPWLRRAYMGYPWPHLYEHPQTECALLIEREWQGEPAVLGAKIRAPEDKTLRTIDREIARFRDAPVEEVSYFRRILRLGSAPWAIRRFVFWRKLYLSGFKRAKQFGTCMVSTIGSLGADHHPLTLLTTYLTWGPIGADGQVRVTVVYDHRVMDGRSVARCLADLEHVLSCEILAELRGMRRAACA